MEKLIYFLRCVADCSGDALRDGLLDKAVPVLRASGAEEISVNVQDRDVVAGTPTRVNDPPIRAFVSFWMQNSDDRALCEAALASHAEQLVGFLVVESRPLVHQRNRGGRSAGMNQVTAIARKPGLDYDEFIRIWHTDHKQVAIEIQSTTGYVRNEILRTLCGDRSGWVAVVEETFPIGALDDRKVFYATMSDAEMRSRADQMKQSCLRFLDYGPMEMTPMSEYYLG